MTKFTKLFCTAFLLLAGGVSASAQDETIDLTADMFYTWDGYGADASSISAATVDFKVGEELGSGAMVAGTSTVEHLIYADLTGCTKMIFEGTAGMQLRVLLNRQESNSGPLVEKNPTIGDNGTAELDLTEFEYVHLNAIKTGWGSPSGTITAIKLVKPADPLAIPKESLKNAISAAKLRTAIGKTEASWNALQAAIATAQTALEAADATEQSLSNAKTAVENAMNNLELAKGYTNLTSGMYFNWSDPENPVALNFATVLFTSTGQPYGDGNVKYFNYADISKYEKLIIGVANGTPRIMLNRAVPLEEGADGYDPNGGAYVQITDAPVDGVVEVDLKQWEFAHLNAIKGANWQPVTVTDLLLYKEPVVTDIEISPAEGDIAAALAAAKEDVDIVGNITINLTEGVTYTVSATLTAPNNLTINGNGATVDASALTDPFITIDGTEIFAMMDAETASDHKYVALDSISGLTITGLQNALIKDAQKTLLETFVIEDCNIQMPAAGKNVVDFNSKGYVGRVSVVNSTIWAAGMNTGFFAQYGSRPKNINGDWLQQFVFENNTIVNIANGKNFNDMKQNGTAQNVYTLKNNIFVNSGKDKQVVVGFNKGQASATPVWDVDGNYFMVGDACTNADEIAKAGKQGEEDIVKNCAEGLLTFTDAAAGNFNGEFTPAEGAEAPESLGDPRWTIETVIPVTHTWDFTKWSEATVTNLKAEAAKVEVMDDPDNEGNTLLVSDNDALWSDHEKAKDKTCDTYAASKDNCFWYIGGEAEPTANGEAIAELKGLQFNASYGTSRSLAIAVNYPSTALGEYAGPSYLWFGGKGKECFTIPSVKGGTTITMGVESHKIAEGRGVQLLVDGTALNDPEGNPVAAPTTYTEQTWQVPEGAAVDVLVKNTNGCHIYFIDAEIDETPVGINDIQQSVVKSDVIYNLNGQQVKNAQKGLYIINGKKVIVK